MKLFNIFASIAFLATAATCSSSDRVDIDWTYTDITVGDTYTIPLVTEATTTQRMVQLALVQKCFVGNCAYKVIRNIAFDLYFAAPGYNVTWTVGAKIPPGDGYALFDISEKKGTDHPQYQYKTSWFTISAPSKKDGRSVEWSG